jgi:teichuronic acid biosynthesis glycosyltransferase TuaC
MSPKKHVLFFSGQFPVPGDLSRCIFASHLARALEQNIRVTVVSPVPYAPHWFERFGGRFSLYAKVPERDRVHGQLVHYPKYLSIPKSPRKAVPVLMKQGVFKTIQALHARDPFDLIHCRWLFPDGAAAVDIADRLKIPSVLTAMGCDMNDYIFHPTIGPIVKNVLAKATALTGVSKALVALMSVHSEKPSKCFYVPNGVNLGAFEDPGVNKEQAKDAVGWKRGERHILFVGRLAPEKNLALLLKSFARLEKQVRSTPVRLWIVGSGPEETKLKALQKELKLTSVTFLGSVEHRKVGQLMMAADLVALSSFQEGMPNVVIEALALGTPVVATPVGAIPDLLHKENGRISASLEPSAFSHALANALDCSWNYAQIANDTKRTWADTANDYIAVYKHALDHFQNSAIK